MESLALAEDVDIQNLLVASDCQWIVNDTINQGTGGPHTAIIQEILDRRSSFQFCNFIHERRNYNFEAHKLAKFSCNLQLGRHVWLETPHDPTVVPMNIALELKAWRVLLKKWHGAGSGYTTSTCCLVIHIHEGAGGNYGRIIREIKETANIFFLHVSLSMN